MELNELVEALRPIGESLEGIESTLRASFEASQNVQQEAMTVLEAHKQSAQEYTQAIEQPEPIDTYPFVEMPTGTTVKDLPDGGRMFLLTDGAVITHTSGGNLTATSSGGATVNLEPTRGGIVSLPDGRDFSLLPGVLRVAHETAGVWGLPVGVEPVPVEEDRYRIELPSGVRLDVDRKLKMLVVSDVSGSTLIFSYEILEGFGEEMSIRLLASGAKTFEAKTSGHKGMVEADGTINLTLAEGLDLVFKFPAPPDNTNGSSEIGQPPKICERHE